MEVTHEEMLFIASTYIILWSRDLIVFINQQMY